MKTFLFSLTLFLFTIAKLYANTILIIGDSLSSAYGFETNKGWVSLMQEKIDREHYCTTLINLSTGGDTTSIGLNKLTLAMKKYKPETVVIALGGNDVLRGISLKSTEDNLQQMIDLSKRKKAKVLLLSTRLPPNYGPLFLKKFKAMFKRLAKENNVPLQNTMLKDVADNPRLMQADGIHPKENAQTTILQNLWPYFRSSIKQCSP